MHNFKNQAVMLLGITCAALGAHFGDIDFKAAGAIITIIALYKYIRS